MTICVVQPWNRAHTCGQHGTLITEIAWWYKSMFLTYLLAFQLICIQRGSRVCAWDRVCSACPNIKATGQAVSEPTLRRVDRRGSGKRMPGPTRTWPSPTGIRASQIVQEARRPVYSWRQSATLVNDGRISTATGCCVRSVSSTSSRAQCIVFQYYPRDWLGRNSPKWSIFLLSGTLNLNQIIDN